MKLKNIRILQRKVRIKIFLGVFMLVIAISGYLYAQLDKKEVINKIQTMQNTPITLENLQQRSQEIKQLLKLLEQKEGKETVERVVTPELKQKFRRAEQSGDYLIACQIADEIIANLAEFAKTAKGESGAGKAGRAPTDEHIVKFKAEDGKGVYGYLLRPKGKDKFPAIVLLHGGKSSKQATMNIGQGPQAQAFNEEGYVTLAVDYRPSEFGGKEIDDVIAGVKYLKNLTFIDPERIGLFGSSHGAYMSLMAAAKLGVQVKAISENFAFTDLGKQYYDVVEGRTSHSQEDIETIIKMGEEYYGGSPKESPQAYMQISPVYNVNRIQASVLIIHGNKDKSVLVYQAYELRDALDKSGKIYEIKIYENCPHGFIYTNTPEAKDALKLTINFFNKYLKETNKSRTNLPKEKLRDSPHQKILRGKIIYVSLEGGFYKLNGYVLVSEDEEIFQKIKNLENKLVEAKGRVKENAVSIFMSGPLFEVEEINEAKETKVFSRDYFDSPFGIFGVFGLAYQQFMKDMGFNAGDYWSWAGSHLKNLNAKWSRENLMLRWYEKEPVLGQGYRWSEWDEKILQAAYEKGGDNFNMVLVISPGRKESGVNIGENEEEFKAFVKTAVERYDGDGIDDFNPAVKVKYWQAYNEPFPNGWKGMGGTTDSYIQFLRLMSEAVKEADPTAKIILGAEVELETFSPGLSKEVKEVISRLNGKKLFDAVDIHYWEFADNWKMEIAQEMHSLLDIHGYKDVEIWSMEHGTYTNQPTSKKKTLLNFQSETEQALFLIKSHIYNFAHGVDRIFWNNLVEWSCFGGRCGGMYDNMGLISDGRNSGETSDMLGVKRLSYYTYQLMTEKVKDSDWNNIQIIRESENIYIYKFNNQGKPIWVAWNEGAEKEVIIPDISSAKVKITEALPNAESGRDLLKDAYPSFFKTEVLSVSNKQLTLKLEKNPVFIEEIAEVPISK